jgi:predicted nucleotidyltransferase
VQVEVEFLAPKEVKLKKNRPKLLADFRVLQADGCGVAFHAPVEQTVSGQNVRGAKNTVRLRVASLTDFLVMKAHAIAGRDKPKDAYDLCYCLEHFPGGLKNLAADWQGRLAEKDVATAVKILQEKFAAVDAFGPQQTVEFHNSPDADVRAMQARRAYELVQHLLNLIR